MSAVTYSRPLHNLRFHGFKFCPEHEWEGETIPAAYVAKLTTQIPPTLQVVEIPDDHPPKGQGQLYVDVTIWASELEGKTPDQLISLVSIAVANALLTLQEAPLNADGRF